MLHGVNRCANTFLNDKFLLKIENTFKDLCAKFFYDPGYRLKSLASLSGDLW